MSHPDGIRFLGSNQGEIREVGLLAGDSWSLDIRPDGLARITDPGRFDASAFAPPGTFDFQDPPGLG
ncbi:hypothetical protein [Aquisphaera giovannonii]|uniref:hypothetical protein n=1 Tax=Aquisphaera giovannonii TaxID=406548 RepID=UPI0011E0512B|nr:hypothetical protein [Aquisphaera giovannonii]